MLEELMRKNIRELAPYRCARDEFEGEAEVYLDANESWRNFAEVESLNRYPDPRATALRKGIESVLGLPFENTVVGSGSDEIIDLLFRIFCNPGRDKVLLMPPTYGAYGVFADINDVKAVKVPLKDDYSMDTEAVLKALAEDENIKLCFICSPNNPTGNAQSLDEIEKVLMANRAITVVDEAYFEFAKRESAVSLIKKYPRLVVLRTLSKCWALAGARIGIGVMNETLQKKMIDVKYPYNIPTPTAQLAVKALLMRDEIIKNAEAVIVERGRLVRELEKLSLVEKVFPSDANFVLARIKDADKVYEYLKGKKIIVRNRSREYNAASCLRITVGSRAEDDRLLAALKEYENE
jgi:histidinol-phosphate aminotransferase